MSLKNILIFLLLTINSSLASNHRTVCVTMPKSGTHLLLKCLNLLNLPGIRYNLDKGDFKKRRAADLESYRKLNQQPPPNHYKGNCHIPTVGELPAHFMRAVRSKNRSFWLHWPHTKQFSQYLEHNTGANFLMIRDPRDLAVSFAFMVQKSPDGASASFESLLLDLIDGRQKSFVPWGVAIQSQYPLIWELGVTDYFKLYTPWMASRNFHTVRFENLVGPLGGGSIKAQLDEITTIAHHMGKKITLQEAKRVADSLFGNAATFREGKLGSWKKYFTPDIKKAFKGAPGANQLLISLGYEKNNAW